jgi:hypothetical protein
MTFQSQTIHESRATSKALFAGFDKPLENAVGRLFKMLGCRVEPGPKARDDLLLQYGKHVAVVEVKGLVKGAREEHVRQTMAWVLGYNERRGKRPKGLLVVNAFRNTPPQKRSGLAFPHAVAAEGQKHGLCLMTSLHLLAFASECQERKRDPREVMRRILSTTGVLSDASAWRPTTADEEDL